MTDAAPISDLQLGVESMLVACSARSRRRWVASHSSKLPSNEPDLRRRVFRSGIVGRSAVGLRRHLARWARNNAEIVIVVTLAGESQDHQPA